jgi:hypothetical protein
VGFMAHNGQHCIGYWLGGSNRGSLEQFPPQSHKMSEAFGCIIDTASPLIRRWSEPGGGVAVAIMASRAQLEQQSRGTASRMLGR